MSYKLGTGRLPFTYILAEQLAHNVTERYIADYVFTHSTVSREDAKNDPHVNWEIAAEISRSERFKKPAKSICEARDRLRMRYERMGKTKIGQLRTSLRKKSVGTHYAKIDDMKQKLAAHFARDGERRGEGNYDALYEEELNSLGRKPDRQIRGIYFTYYDSDGTEKPEQEITGKRLTRAERTAERFYKENEDGVPDAPFDKLSALYEKRRPIR